ncbi:MULTISPECIES: MAPEG family protein [unclassified Bradyrhizobium]|uniref:MAPEG family protein n=1 Tax=unclassified Bradyrhizobium TaxID=2631580 RepID=UPI00247A1020|nr:MULTISPECIES: MAPEG family protein [unclassified Bradyrhizobium]WGS20509.1 MAPEG family protein [Bradyrhizobium sp. ISRA463]WGS27392.1 MAPEG family protein [Bradyrhizobium sp. ISRA464]
MYHYTAIVTCLAVALHFFFATQVARARIRYDVKLPAITGNPDFERIYRIQMNTLEWMPIFLPSLWLFAIYVGDVAAAAIGAIWIVGRIVYFIGYREAVASRTPGFAIQAFAAIILWIGALGGAVWRLAHG